MQHIYQENQKDSLISMEVNILLDMVLEHIYFVLWYNFFHNYRSLHWNKLAEIM